MAEPPASKTDYTDRRRFIRCLAFSCIGALTVSKIETFKLAWREGSELATSLWQHNKLTGETLPPQLLRSSYAAFLAIHGFQNIPVQKIIAPHHNWRAGIQNSLPPEKLWKNILPTLKVADRLAAELGERIQINSAYRSPQYNAVCPGAAKWSQHLKNNALDICFRSKPGEVARAARDLRMRGFFQGGIGVYAHFVHIDTRGKNHDW